MKHSDATKILSKTQKAARNFDRGFSQKISGIKAIVWNFYQTLVWAEPFGDYCDANFRKALRFAGITPKDCGSFDFGRAFTDMQKAHKDIRAKEGVKNPEVDLLLIYEDLLENLVSENLVEGKIDKATIKKLAVNFEILSRSVWLMPNAIRTLNALKDCGIKMITLSNAQFFAPYIFPVITGKSMAQLGFDEENCVWSFSYRRAKPSNILFESAAQYFEKTYSFSPKTVLYVGSDMQKDIIPAAKAGFKTAFFTNNENAHFSENGVIPDIVVHDLIDVAKLVA